MSAKMRLIFDVQALKSSEWKTFVCEHSQGNIFQTPEMDEVNQKSMSPFFSPLLRKKMRYLE
jgi:hypothetical protein